MILSNLSNQSMEIITSRIEQLNEVLKPGSPFSIETWPRGEGLAHIHVQGAWDKIIFSLKILSVDGNRRSKFSKKVKESDDYGRSSELTGEIITAAGFVRYNPKLEFLTTGKKDVDIALDIGSKRVLVEITTLNLSKENSDLVDAWRENQETMKVPVVYWGNDSQRIKTAVRQKIIKSLPNTFNFVLLYNLSGANDESLLAAAIGSYVIDSQTKSWILGERGIFYESSNKQVPLHGIGLFDWNWERLLIIYNPGLEIPDDVEKIFSGFVEVK